MIELARKRLLPRLGEPVPLVILEGVTGLGKRTLLRQWSAERSPRRVRALVEFDPRQPGEPAVVTQVLRALERQQVPIATATYAEAASATGTRASELLQSVIGPLGEADLALVGAERMPPAAFEGFAHAHRRLPGLRVLLETTDATGTVRRAAADDLPLVILEDAELALDPAEVAALLAALDVEPAPSAAEALWRASRGHAGQVVAALRRLPRECLSGVVTRSQVLRHWPSGHREPSRYERCLLQLAHLPWFTPDQARQFTALDAGPGLFRRMTTLGLGETRTVPGSPEAVFRWDEEVRQTLLRAVPPAAGPGAFQAVAGSAARSGDRALAAAALVQAGDLAAAEATVRQGLCEALDPMDLTVWQPLLRLPHAALGSQPALQLVRMVVARRSGTTSPRVAVRLAQYARRLAGRHRATPLERLTLLALATRAACEAGELGEASDYARRWADLAVAAHPVLVARPGEAVALTTAMSEALVRLDQLSEAARAADLTLEVLDQAAPLDVGNPDSRRDTALRVRRCATALLDHADPDDPAAAVVPLRDGQVLELDEVLVAVHEAWLRLDTGDLAGAEQVTAAALGRVSRPGDWPILLLTRAVALIGTRQRCALEQLRARYLDDPGWRRRHFGPHRAGWVAAILDLLVPRALGRRCLGQRCEHPDAGEVVSILEGYLHNRPRVLSTDELGQLPRRARKLALSLKSLALLRAGDVDQAGETFALVCGDLPDTGALPLAFAFAEPAEVDRLAATHRDQSAACHRHLSYARRVASAVPTPAGVQLTAREVEILAALRRGDSNRQIAEDLVVSVNTVKFHRANLYRKLGAATRVEALAAAVRLGF